MKYNLHGFYHIYKKIESLKSSPLAHGTMNLLKRF